MFSCSFIAGGVCVSRDRDGDGWQVEFARWRWVVSNSLILDTKDGPND